MEDSFSILESLSEGIVAFDEDREAIMTNPYFVSLMGWEGEVVEGKASGVLFADRPEILRILDDAFCERRLASHADLVHHRDDGVLQHLRVSTSYLPTESAKGVVLVVRDVSELKRMEWEIFQVEKMSALGRLAASVAHEVRNPLGAIGIQLQLLEEDLGEIPSDLRDRILRRLNIAQTEMKRMDRIVDTFLRFSRTPKLRLQKIFLNHVVARVFELVIPEAREQDVRLILDLAEGLPPVSGDENQLSQAILNMTVNAFQSIEGEGELRAKTWGEQNPDRVCLALVDTGKGISEEELDHVFEFYFTTKDEGTGLGLSIAQQIIYQHQGHIEVESVEGEGSTFRVFLPASEE